LLRRISRGKYWKTLPSEFGAGQTANLDENKRKILQKSMSSNVNSPWGNVVQLQRKMLCKNEILSENATAKSLQ
jgi:hypothetical protein